MSEGRQLSKIYHFLEQLGGTLSKTGWIFNTKVPPHKKVSTFFGELKEEVGHRYHISYTWDKGVLTPTVEELSLKNQ